MAVAPCCPIATPVPWLVVAVPLALTPAAGVAGALIAVPAPPPTAPAGAVMAVPAPCCPRAVVGWPSAVAGCPSAVPELFPGLAPTEVPKLVEPVELTRLLLFAFTAPDPVWPKAGVLNAPELPAWARICSMLAEVAIKPIRTARVVLFFINFNLFPCNQLRPSRRSPKWGLCLGKPRKQIDAQGRGSRRRTTASKKSVPSSKPARSSPHPIRKPLLRRLPASKRSETKPSSPVTGTPVQSHSE